MLPPIPNLTDELWSLVRQIPRGQVATYGDIARALGDVVASRYVGQSILHHEHESGSCHCHRLVRSDGTMGRFVTGNVLEKARLLEDDGVTVENGKINLNHYRFGGFRGARPLEKLAEYQRQAAAVARSAKTNLGLIQRVGGVDLSYVPGTNDAIAALVEYDLGTQRVIAHRLLRQKVAFPYVTSYLAFRELPILFQLLSSARKERCLPEVVLVDGSGVLHPRQAGIATMLGVGAGLRTIGVTKTHLTGEVDLTDLQLGEFREVWLAGQLSGFALRPPSGTKKPLYISPGCGLDAPTSLTLVQRSLQGRRLPEPIYWADRFSREAAQAQCRGGA